MKDKIAICVMMAVFSVPTVTHAMRWGTDFVGSQWTMDGKDFRESLNNLQVTADIYGYALTKKLTQGNLGGTASLFVEGNSRLCLGTALGYGVMPSVSVKYGITNSLGTHIDFALVNKTVYIPLDLYLKYTTRSGKFSLSGGGGADYVMARTDFSDVFSDGAWIKASFTQKKVVPHVQAGCELFLAKWISLSLGVKYLFSAVLDNLRGNVVINGGSKKKSILIMHVTPPVGQFIGYRETSKPPAAGDRPLKYDLSGVRANFGLRVYFK